MTALLQPREPTLAAYSACRLCSHSIEAGLELACDNPELRDPFYGPQPVILMRAAGNPCGPNAKHMQARYLNPTARPL